MPGAQEVFRRFAARASDRTLERTLGSRGGQRLLFRAMAARFDPSAAAGFSGDIRYVVGSSGRMARTWTITCSAEAARVISGPGAGEPVVTVRVGAADLVRIAAGALDPGAALLGGRLDLAGDFAVATRLGDMFGAPSPRR